MRVIVRPVSFNCNKSCLYCPELKLKQKRTNIDPLVMHSDIVDAIVEKFSDNIYEFVAGEPTLAGLTFYRYFFEKIKNNQICFHTNGSLINKSWVNLFKKYNVIVYIKLDDNDQKALTSYHLLKDNDVNVVVETTIYQKNIDYPKQLFDLYIQNGIDVIKMNITDTVTKQKLGLFLKTITHCWQMEYTNKHYMHFNFIDEAINVLTGYPSSICGSCGICQNNIVINSNGDCFNCNHYLIDDYCLGNIVDNTKEELLKNDIFFKKERSISSLCFDCRYLKACYGGCQKEHSIICDETYCARKDVYTMLIEIMKVLY